jgi:hypothetical protein
LKVFNKYFPKDDNEDREIDHILRVFRAYQGVTTSMMIRASWEKAGFGYHQRDGTFYLSVDEGRIPGGARLVRNLREELSHRVLIGPEEESEMGKGEPTILPREICEAIKMRPKQLNNL